MKDKQARDGLRKLCERFGVSYDDSFDTVEIGKWDYTLGGNPNKLPVTRKDLKYFADQCRNDRELLDMLMRHLGLHVFDGREIRKNDKK